MRTAAECHSHQALSVQYPRALEWFEEIRPWLVALDLAALDPRIQDAIVALDAIDAAMEGATNDNVPELVCGGGAAGCVPDGAEVCDGVDNDCNGLVDEGFDLDNDEDNCGGCGIVCDPSFMCQAGVCVAPCGDSDLDGFNDISCGGTDCDDLDAAINPAAPELCDGVDNDCNGMIDEGFDLSTDVNHCGACNAACGAGESCAAGVCVPGCADLDADGFLDIACGGLDCDDTDPSINPAAPEDCDGLDNNCDGVIDEGFDLNTDVNHCGACNAACGAGESCAAGVCVADCADLDADGHNDAACGGGDCDDTDPTFHPGAAELCDGLDHDCDGRIDNGCVPCEEGEIEDCIGSCTPAAWLGDGFCDVQLDCAFYNSDDGDCLACGDGDGDGHNDAACGGDDCDDSAPLINPSAVEVCDGIDNNCEGGVDEGFDLNSDVNHCGGCNVSCGPDEVCAAGVCAADCADADVDGFYDMACGGLDCDDADPTISPAAPEDCDGLDNNCDGVIDEGNPGGGASCDGVDADQCEEGTLDCVAGALVCSDNSGDSVEICNGLDDDCNLVVDDDCSCAAGEVVDCFGLCTPGLWIGDGFCDFQLDCAEHSFDDGDCIPE